MADLKNKFLSVDLKNPIIVGSSNLITDLDIVRRIEDAGAAAIVNKSLFEEQTNLENIDINNATELKNNKAESTSLFAPKEHIGLHEFLNNLTRLKETVSIPVFASLNCVYDETWIEYTKLIQETGVNGIELNFYATPKDFDIEAGVIETHQVETLKAIKQVIQIPVGVKLSPYYTSPLNFIKRLDNELVNGLILFNRLFQPDIDIDSKKNCYPFDLTSENEIKLSLRYAGLLYEKIAARITCNTGVYNGGDVVKMILAGAENVQIVSTIYKNKPEVITKMLDEIEKWMTNNNYEKLSDFRGLLSKKHVTDPHAYKRAQYVDILLNSDKMIEKYPI